MVDLQIRGRGIRDPKVLAAIERVPRHLFVPEDLRAHSYADEPLPIGEGQTISQPYIVAYMTEILKIKGSERILEVGTGSGYQAAILAEIAREVFTVEIVENLSLRAQKTLSDLGYRNLHFHRGDGAKGWPEYAPYDAIMVTAAAARVPDNLAEQLGRSGRMIIPVGTDFQELVLIRRQKKAFKQERLLSVRFVPLVEGHRTH